MLSWWSFKARQRAAAGQLRGRLYAVHQAEFGRVQHLWVWRKLCHAGDPYTHGLAHICSMSILYLTFLPSCQAGRDPLRPFGSDGGRLTAWMQGSVLQPWAASKEMQMDAVHDQQPVLAFSFWSCHLLHHAQEARVCWSVLARCGEPLMMLQSKAPA